MTRQDDRLDSEIQHHLDLLAAEYESRGMPPEEARMAARRAFGGVEPMKERYRDGLRLRWLEDLGHDMRYAMRGLRRNPGFTAVAVLTLAFGIGATTALFSVIDAVMLRPLPVHDPGDLRLISVKGPNPIPSWSFSYPVYQDMRRQVPGLAGVALFGGVNRLRMTATASPGSEVEAISGQVVSGNFFSLLGIRPAAGRLLDDGDDRPGARSGAVLSHGFWARRFAREPSVVGGEIIVNNVPMTVVGVAAPGFTGIEVGAQPDVWFHTAAFPQVFGNAPGSLANRGLRIWRLIARLREGASPLQAEAQAEAVYAVDRQARLERTPPLSADERALIATGRVRLEPGRSGFSTLRWQFRQPLFVLLTVVALVLLIACANVANLLLARAASRVREMTVRMALGSGRGRLVRQQLVESLLLAGIGGVAGISIAMFGGRIVAAFLDTQELNVAVTMDMRVLGFTMAVSAAAAVIAGVMPALMATRLDLARRDGRAIAGPPRLLVQHTLVIAQVALSIVVLVGAGLFLRTLAKLQQVDTGFDRNNLATVSLEFPPAVAQPARLKAYRELLARLNAVPGQRAALSMFGMLSGNGWSDPIRVPGDVAREGDDLDVQRMVVSAGFFEVTGMRIVAGRPFTPEDDARPTQAAIVNEDVARRFFGGNAVGRELSIGRGEPFEVVGVVANSVYRNLRDEAGGGPPTIYVPALQGPATLLIMRDVQLQVRTSRAAPVESQVRDMVRQVHPAILVTGVQSMDAIVDGTIARERLLADLAGWLGFVSLALGGVGIYGVRSYAVNRRVPEIGVRLALGATAAQVAGRVVREGVAIAGIGTVIGLIAAAGLTRFIGTLLFGVTPLDALTFAAAAALVVGVAMAASYVPAMRATRVDPVAALRSE
jgi:predicted permease